jgi:hypothetical protein
MNFLGGRSKETTPSPKTNRLRYWGLLHVKKVDHKQLRNGGGILQSNCGQREKRVEAMLPLNRISLAGKNLIEPISAISNLL